MIHSEIEEMVDYLKYQRVSATMQQTNTAVRYFNLPMAFDIETSSFTVGVDKTSIMYLWSFACGDKCCTGRTWSEFMYLYQQIVKIFECSVKRFRVIIYIHNLQYEFQQMRKRFQWGKIFAVDNRKPLYQLTGDGVEFRCSYLLSGCNLDTVQKNLQFHKIEKLKGFLDFSLIRHSETVLSEKEIQYSKNDVLILTAYIDEQIKINGNINKIPLTKTGYVREYCRNFCFYGTEKRPRKQNKQYFRFKKWMKQLTLQVDEFRQLRRAFQGGFTHANSFYTNKTLDNVTSFDFTSSYPAVMVASDRFPVQPGEYIDAPDEDQFKEVINNDFQVFEVEFEELESTVYFEHYLSEYKCTGKGFITDNGRIQQASRLVTTTTSIDWLIISNCYQWKSVKIWGMWRYRTGYLPTNFVKSILKLYERKTSLKGVKGKEVEYLLSKEMLNSCYGMSVCVKELTGVKFDYDDSGWTRTIDDLAKTIKKYNNKQSRFLFYVWGLVITAEQRLNLWSGILTTGQNNDYIYSDTDSIKILNQNRYKKYITNYNNWITDRLKTALKYHGLPDSLIEPKTITGEMKQLGVWELDGVYNRFKTLGAKRYIVEDTGGEISITVAGVSKSQSKYLVETYDCDVFENFTHGLYFPKGETGKQTHTYIDCERKGVITDYQGNDFKYHELSGTHLEDSDYLLSLSMDYIEFLRKEKLELESFLEV